MGLTWWERKARVRGVKLAGQANLSLPIKDKALEFNGAPIWVSDGYFSGTEPTRVTIPAGCGGVYSIHAVVHWGIYDSATFFPQIRDGNYFITQVAKNGGVSGHLREACTCNEPAIPATTTRQEVLWEAPLAASNYIEILISSEVVDQNIMDLYGGLYGVSWKYQLEYWLTVRRLGRII